MIDIALATLTTYTTDEQGLTPELQVELNTASADLQLELNKAVCAVFKHEKEFLTLIQHNPAITDLESFYMSGGSCRIEVFNNETGFSKDEYINTALVMDFIEGLEDQP